MYIYRFAFGHLKMLPDNRVSARFDCIPGKCLKDSYKEELNGKEGQPG